MDRREFLLASGLVPGAFVSLSADELKRNGVESGSHKFQVTSRVEVLKPEGTTRVWIPEPLITSNPFQRTLKRSCDCQGGVVKEFKKKGEGLGITFVKFPSGVQPVLTISAQITTRNWAVKLAAPTQRVERRSSELEAFLRPTMMLPTDGIVKQKALTITKNVSGDLAKARAIYEWVVANTYRKSTTRGCGRGNIRFMLESGDLGGKCADINALYVGLARAVGIPARDVYGIRVGASQLGYKSLGTSSTNISKAQHCRAEVFLTDFGWIPLDPADVRKVALEEPPGDRPLQDSKVAQAKARLFGAWEMNWIAYNYAQDVQLPGSTRPALHFLMYPQAETESGQLDSLDPENFKYEITAHKID